MLALAFAVELLTMGVLAWAGASASGGTAVRVLLAIAGPVVLAVIWGLVMAPRARRRLPEPSRLVAELVIFAASAAALALAGHVLPAVVYAVIAISVAVLARFVTPGA
jgi:hypothetical protein